jgi:hypothetical protein
MESTLAVFAVEVGLAFVGCLLALVVWEAGKKLLSGDTRKG